MSVPVSSFGRMEKTGVVSVAVIVPAPELLRRMLREKPACWQWAAFASVLFHRWAAVEERKINQVLGLPVQPAGRLVTGAEVMRFVAKHMRDADDIIAEVSVFLSTPDLMAALGGPDGENSADGEGILRAGNQLGDYYTRLLELAENCRRYSVPEHYAELVGDCIRFMNQALQDFCGFVNDVLERLEELQRRVILGEDHIRFDPVQLRFTTDDHLVWSIMDRLQTID
jgi:hypothetical protein